MAGMLHFLCGASQCGSLCFVSNSKYHLIVIVLTIYAHETAPNAEYTLQQVKHTAAQQPSVYVLVVFILYLYSIYLCDEVWSLPLARTRVRDIDEGETRGFKHRLIHVTFVVDTPVWMNYRVGTDDL